MKSSPVTCLRFRPGKEDESLVLLSGNANGDIQHWHQNTGYVLHYLM